MSTVRNRYVVVALALLLGSCQSAGPARQVAPERAAWRVLERVGEAHARMPGAGGWTEIMARDEISAASTLVTGTGGRLILARPDRQLVVGPKSRLHLAQAERKGGLEQIEGRVRYRIAGAAFVVVTPALNVQASDTVLEVSVGAGATEVTVEEGEARVATLDGRPVAVVAAGGSARGGGADDAGLMVRGALEQDYARVEPVRASRRQPAPEPAAEPARAAADDGGPEPVVVPAGFWRQTGAEAKGADVPPDAAESDRTPEHQGPAAPPRDAVDDPFAGFTDGLLGSLSAVGPDTW